MERSDTEASPRRSAFDRIQPPLRERLGVRGEGRMFVDIPAMSQQGDSGEVSLSPSRRQREGWKEAQADLPWGILDQVPQEFNRWKREQGPQSVESDASLLRTQFTTGIMRQQTRHRARGKHQFILRQHAHAGVLDVVICRAFYYTLSGMAAEWFKSLEPVLISSFANLARNSVQWFTTSKPAQKHFTYLEKDKQHEGEFLAIFFVKWKNPIGKVEPMDDRKTINVLHSSLRVGALYQDFILLLPSTYQEAIRRAIDYANVGEANSAKRWQEVRPSQ